MDEFHGSQWEQGNEGRMWGNVASHAQAGQQAWICRAQVGCFTGQILEGTGTMYFCRMRSWAAAFVLSSLLTAGSAPAAVAQEWTPSCGEGCDDCSQSSCGCITDPHVFFDKLTGEDNIFGGLKNQQVGGMTYSVGGELRHRYMNEKNRLRPPGPPGNFSYEYHLWRFTLWIKMQFNERVGAFVEAIDAAAFTEGDIPYFPVGIDENREIGDIAFGKR